MKTSQEFQDNLRHGVITDSMLEEVLFSFNKRAKNHRDIEARISEERYFNRDFHDKYNSEEKACEKKEEYYEKKEDILLRCPNHLVAIHKVVRPTTERIDEYDECYIQYNEDIARHKRGEKSRVIRMSEYYDREINEMVSFIIVQSSFTEYYLYYEFPNFSFHQPIDSPDDYKGLEVIELSSLVTKGENINALLSCQFCNKVWQFIVENWPVVDFMSNERRSDTISH